MFQFEKNDQRSQIMKSIKSKGTKPEIRLAKALWAKGLRYRKNCDNLPGKPDIVLKRYKLAVFVDGEFWHGYDWDNKKNRISINRDYWIPKIEKNIKRDQFNNEQLQNLGWTVIRFWSKDVNHNLEKCVETIISLCKA